MQSETVVQYWDERAQTYSNGIESELGDHRHTAWSNILAARIGYLKDSGKKCVRALDLGCGPGFFTTILSTMGCQVTALDSSTSMIEAAKRNVALHGNPDNVRYVHADVSYTGLESESFDLIVLRNVTWLMAEPRNSYQEWKRLLAKNGRMLVFDANWYSYLANEDISAQRSVDQADQATLGWSEDERANDDQEYRCEQIALELPLTYETRPQWDYRVLSELGFSHINIDTDVWRSVWSEGEKAYYATSPLFMIETVK